jgi:hypothetical protein
MRCRVAISFSGSADPLRARQGGERASADGKSRFEAASARSSPSQAQKRRVLACPVLYRSGAPEEIRTPDPQIRSLVLYPSSRSQYVPNLPLFRNGACGLLDEKFSN